MSYIFYFSGAMSERTALACLFLCSAAELTVEFDGIKHAGAKLLSDEPQDFSHIGLPSRNIILSKPSVA